MQGMREGDMLETLQGEILGVSEGAVCLRRFVEAAAQSCEPATLSGEPGTGKELAARLIHEGSARGKAPFLMVDCSLYYERELKRELFGYLSSGASAKSRKGLFEFASRGTCYMSRIEELSPGIQASILELLRTGRFARLGDGKAIASGVRLIASSDKNLAGFVEAGLFDATLYAEITKLSVAVAPLRQRREDIPALVEYMADAAAARATDRRPAFTPEALEALKAYPWPGNLDELSKEVLRLTKSGLGTVRPESLSTEIANLWHGQGGDSEVRKVLEQLDGYIREFRVLNRLDLDYRQLLEAVSGDREVEGACGRDLLEGA
ncbi:MAG: sigma-54-dependent Fis family transcriptional regulator [Planctomycetes bacterium]|nr:sigma-54-dependent Fis family transcriptional regulator [Planctomycetota bacterium]